MRKKLFAILMSAMMMVTFMPSMAFAYEAGDTDLSKKVTWDADYAGLTYDGIHYKATRAKSGETPWDGLMVATCEFAESKTDMHSYAEIEYYDLDFAKLDGTTVNGHQFASTVFTASEFAQTFTSVDAKTNVFVKLSVPTYVSGNADASDTDTKVTNLERTLTVDTPVYDETKPYETQSFELKAGYNYPAGATALKGTAIAPLTIQVKKETPAIDQAKYTVDGKLFKYSDGRTCSVDGRDTGINVAYDAAEHVIGVTEVPGVAVTFESYDSATGKWNVVDEVKVKDAGEYEFRVTGKLAGATDNVETLTVNVTTTRTQPVFGFDYNDAEKAYVFNVGKNFKPADFVVLNDNKLVAANKDLLMEYFNDFYTVTLDESKYVDGKVVATIAPKTNAELSKATVAELNAFVDKYGVLFQNLGLVQKANRDNFKTVLTGLNNTAARATFYVTSDIEWTKAPLVKTYHNKKGALKKTHTFTVKAVADNAVTYKLTNGGSFIKINKTTGKVTVKKGLKKGTYTVKVTAKAGSATDTYEMKVKVVK